MLPHRRPQPVPNSPIRGLTPLEHARLAVLLRRRGLPVQWTDAVVLLNNDINEINALICRPARPDESPENICVGAVARRGLEHPVWQAECLRRHAAPPDETAGAAPCATAHAAPNLYAAAVVCIAHAVQMGDQPGKPDFSRIA